MEMLTSGAGSIYNVGTLESCAYQDCTGFHSTMENSKSLKKLEAIWNFLFNIFGYSSATAGSESNEQGRLL